MQSCLIFFFNVIHSGKSAQKTMKKMNTSSIRLTHGRCVQKENILSAKFLKIMLRWKLLFCLHGKPLPCVYTVNKDNKN